MVEDLLVVACFVGGVSAVMILILGIVRLIEGSNVSNRFAPAEEYLETHPPISDEEFLTLCDPNVDPRIALRVRELIAEVGCLDKSIIYPDARFIEDLWLD